MALTKNPLWYKEAIIYEIPIRAFRDSNADGIGDLRGVIEKLDYLSDLGITAIWLLPFYPSPHLDGGYDISDYTSVHPMYGTLQDFRELLAEAHARGIRVITELVINHTSKEHPWFQASRRSAPGTPWREFYVWSDDPKRYRDARIIFKDFETSNWTWDPEAKAYYWHRFYQHQPDLNFDNPAVHEAVLAAMDFWFDLGVDGLRLDAIPYLYEREGTTSENLPETHAFLKKLRAHVDAKYEGRMLLAEANQWPEDAVAYFGDGDECHMNFHFPLMPRMFMAVQMEDRFPIIDILEQTPVIPDNCQWATFLRNHDELTLEMVTDEDRDYMYRVYAEDPGARLNLGIRRRLAPLLGGRQEIELMMGLLFSLPGTPVLYYGDEIGMGDNIYLGDRDGVRTPMQWSADKNAGFSSANPQKLYLPVTTDPEFRYEAVNVEAQQANTSSLLWWTKRLVALRKKLPSLSRGGLTFLYPDNPRVLAFVRDAGEETVLVVANLSRLHQWVELDLAGYAGRVPVEATGGVQFPRVDERHYVIMVPPHGFLWLLLDAGGPRSTRESLPPLLELNVSLSGTMDGPTRHRLERVLESYAAGQRWFQSKDKKRTGARLVDLVPLGESDDGALALVEFSFHEGEPELYVLPLALLSAAAADEVLRKSPRSVVAEVAIAGSNEIRFLVEGIGGGVSLTALLNAFFESNPASPRAHRLSAEVQPRVHELLPSISLPARFDSFEQTNTTLPLGGKLLLKLYRQVAFGAHPEIEIGRFLANKNAPAPRWLGCLEYRNEGERAALAVLHEFVPNEGNAWELVLTRLRSYFDFAIAETDSVAPLSGSRPSAPVTTPELGSALSTFLPLVELLGRRVAELHEALVGDANDPAFVPEPFSSFHQKSIYQRARTMLLRTFQSLARAREAQPPRVRELVDRVLAEREEIDRRLRRITVPRFEIGRIRTHGDLHLGQVLYTGQDFVVIDFEGEPARPLHERSYKRCPLRDVMGLVRSFNYATAHVLRSGNYRDDDVVRLEPWARAWEKEVRARLVGAYLDRARGAVFLPHDDDSVRELLDFYELEKVIYELRYELTSRPEWLELPLGGLIGILER